MELMIGKSVRLEFAGSETVKRATVVSRSTLVLGAGYTFQVGKGRVWVYEKDLLAADDPDYLTVMDGR